MNSEIKKLASETIFYGFATILPRTLNFLLVPLHTRVFAQEAYGDVSELYGYVAFFNIVFLFGMETAFFRFTNKEGLDPAKVFRMTQTVVSAISVFLSGIFLIFYRSIAQVFSISESRIIVWICLTMLVDAMVAIPFARLRQQNKVLRFTSFKLINITLLIGFNVYFLWLSGNPNPGIELVFLANFLANAAYVIFFFKDLISWKPLFDRKLSPEILSYSYPVVLTGLAGMTNEMFSRISIDNWLPKDFYPGKSADYVQGVFAACYRFSVFMSLVVMAFRFAAEPFFFSKSSDKNSPELFAKINHYFILIASAIMVGICLNLDWLKYFIDAGYWEGLNIVPVLLLGYIFLGVYYNISIWFKVTDRTHFGTIITFVGAGVTVGLNYILIPAYGIMGSSLVTLICYFSMTALCYGIGQRYYPVPYTLGKDLGIITMACLIVFVNDKIVINNVALSIGIRGVASLLVMWVVYSLTFRKDMLYP